MVHSPNEIEIEAPIRWTLVRIHRVPADDQMANDSGPPTCPDWGTASKLVGNHHEQPGSTHQAACLSHICSSTTAWMAFWFHTNFEQIDIVSNCHTTSGRWFDDIGERPLKIQDSMGRFSAIPAKYQCDKKTASIWTLRPHGATTRILNFITLLTFSDDSSM